MGYESHWTGQVRIEPSLTWGEIKTSRCPGFNDLTLRLDEHVEETLTGQTRIITAAVVEPRTREAFNGYDIDTELQNLIDAHPTHKFTGAIEARPLDPGGTPWRYIISGRKVVRQEQRLIWPGDDATADQVEQARRIAVALEQENARLAEQVGRVRAWATSHEYRWLHELLDGYGTHGGHL